MAVAMKEVFQAVDSMDAQAFAAHFTEDGRFRFGNAPSVTGRQAITKSVDDFFAALDSLQHEILDVWEQDGTVISEVEVTYNRKDGARIDLPAVTVARCDGDEIADYRIYMDINPLFAS